MAGSEKFASASELQKKLGEAGITGSFSMLDSVVQDFIGRIADQEKEGSGLFVDWQLSMTDALDVKYSDLVRKSVQAQFLRVVKALATDEEVKNAAIAAYYS